jgi:ectoine hydroxylase-related dioxygenase (phytanoyl-CoA dioxygenase family)
VAGILQELGTDLDDCYLDVPKLRTAYPAGHLTKGIAFAFAGHRDTWYGAPQAQINWWMPIYPLAADNAMAFYPRYFAAPVVNDSERFNYYRRNVERRDVTQFITEDPRIQPSALELGPDEPEFRLLPPVGGIIVFSGAQLHATVTNPTSLSRYSVDFRTVSRRDVERGVGAPNVDARCTGTALRDFLRTLDKASMPDDTVRLLDPVGPAEDELAVFKPGA